MYKIKDIYGQGMTTDYTITGMLLSNDIKALDIVKQKDPATKNSFDKQKVLYKYGDLYFNEGLQTDLELNPKWGTVSSALLPIILTFKDNWNKKYNALMSEYNPIENYRRETQGTRQDTTENTRTGQNTTTGTDTTTDTSNDFIYGYDSDEATPSGKSNSQNEINTNKTDTQNSTENGTNNGTYSETVSGNIGVTTSQQMIESELQLRNYNLIDEIYQVIIGELTEKY